MTDEAILRLEHISKGFPGVQALDDVSIAVGCEVHGLVGENGAGKSTLIRILAGAYTKDSGDIFLRERRINVRNPRQALGLGICAVFQEIVLVPYMSVAENIFLGREPCLARGMVDFKRMYNESRKSLRNIGVEDVDPQASARTYSIADQQLICIARAVGFERTNVLILDESTSSLSPPEVDRLFGVIGRVVKNGTAVIYISHRLQEVVEICDRVTVLRDGKVVSLVGKHDLGIDRLTEMMIGRSIEHHFPQRHRIPQERKTILEIRGLSRRGAFSDVNLTIKTGEVLGLAGLLGAGRTALARTIFGADPKDTGAFFLDGKKVEISSPRHAIAHGIAYLSEDRRLEGVIRDLPVKHNITLANLKGISRLFGFIRSGMEKRISSEYVNMLEIRTPSIERMIRYLSGGNQQKVMVARWLFAEARIVIFDEPTRGIDVGTKSEIYKVMNDIADQDKAVIVISSEIPEIVGISDRIVVMREGRIVGELTRADENRAEKALAMASGI